MNTSKRKLHEMRHLSPRHFKTFLMCCWANILLMSGLAVPTVLAAQQTYTSYITPFTNNQKYQFYVFGDKLATGLSKALQDEFAKDANIEFSNHANSRAGLSNQFQGNLERQISSLLNSKTIHVAVIMMGPNDTRQVWKNKKRYPVSSDLVEWKQIYESRITSLTRKLKARNIAVYWVGLPIMQDKDFNETLQLLNDTYREMAYRSNIKFIDTWNGFTDQYGQYTPYAADVDGQIKRLRDKNGVYFTPEGYAKLAHYVQREIRRDLSLAKEERNIPLAGDVEEQHNTMLQTRDRLRNPRGPGGLPAKPVRKTILAGFKTKIETSKEKPLNAQNKRAIADTYGGIMALDINNGLTALISISSTNNLGVVNHKNSQTILPLVKRPYYRVLVKGEVLKSKSNRADDFTWSR